ncbi:MAG: hypothetical protein RL732_146 [Bacteroidota bacterium]
MKPSLLFEHNDLLVANKPAGLLSIPDREGKEVSLKKLLQEQYGQVFTVHRLDKFTSGLIVFARTEALHRFLSEAFEQRQVEKDYYGLVAGKLADKQKLIDAPIMEHPAQRGTMMIHPKGKPSQTQYEVEEELGNFSWLRFRIFTGRTHQIRVHMKLEGHPIVCDPLYGDGQPLLLSTLKKKFKLSKQDETERPLLNRLALHAYRLVLPLPDGGQMAFEAPLPKDLQATLQQLRKIFTGKEKMPNREDQTR